MPDYRIFFCNDAGSIVGTDALTAEDDSAVLMAARCLLDECPALEVWHLSRRIGRLVPERSTVPENCKAA
jgi:hypothetical protein